MRCLPAALSSASSLLVTSWGHESSEVATQSVLSLLQDALLHSPVLLQVEKENKPYDEVLGAAQLIKLEIHLIV